MKQPMLIISQCYHSYHIFVVQFDSDTFLKNAQDFIFELCDHRRKEERKEAREDFDEYGDVKEKYFSEERHRYNVNDCSGDIYFITRPSVMHLMREIREYTLKSHKETHGRGYLKKCQLQHVDKYHRRDDVAEIVRKHFEYV